MLITCSNCQSKIRVPDSAAGKKGKCPKCGTVITIPAAEEPIEAAIEPEPVEAAPPPEPEPVAEQPAGSPFDFNESAPPTMKKGGHKVEPEDDEILEEPVETDEEEDDRPSKKKKKRQESIGLSLTSLILGAVSLVTGSAGGCCCPLASTPITLLLAVAALILGFIGMKKGGKVLAIIGMALGGVGVVLFLVWVGIMIFYFATGAAMNMGQMRRF